MAAVCTLTLLTITARTEAADDGVKASIQKYMKSWNEPDKATRTALLTAAWAEDAIYTDPSAHVEGRKALINHIQGFMTSPQTKGASIVPGSDIDIHHNVFRFEWAMKDASGNIVTRGMDYGEFNDDGVITKIIGFFGPFPEMKAGE